MKKLTQDGFAHILLPLIVIVLIAVVGTYVLIASHANSCPVPRLVSGALSPTSGPVSGATTVTSGPVSGVVSGTQFCGAASAPVKPVSTLSIRHTMRVGGQLTSANRNYRFVFRQRDNNLAIVNVKGQEVWSAGVAGKNGTQLQFRTDGNLVLLNPSGAIVWQTATGKTKWLASSMNKKPSKLVVQNDGRLVILSPSGREVWASTPPVNK